MKIVYNIAATYNSGGMERVLANKANYLAMHGHDVLIVTTDQADRKPYYTLDERIAQADLGINYFESQGQGLVRKAIAYLKKQEAHKKRLSRLLIDHKADIVISMFDHEASFLYSIGDGSKKVLEIHFSRFKRLQYGRKGVWALVDKWRNRNDMAIARRYDRFVVLTREDRRYWGVMNNIEVIPNSHGLNGDIKADLLEKRVMAVGRYDEQKNFEELIRVWAEVIKEFPDWSLYIYGDGPQRAQLMRLVVALKLQKSVHLHPPVKSIEKEYLQSAVLAMTSRYEGLPMALLEGQACGLPLVAYACKCGPRDIIMHSENGYLVEPGDRVDFAEKLMHLMRDPAARKLMGETAKKRSPLFSEDRVMQLWVDLFKELMKPKALNDK